MDSKFCSRHSVLLNCVTLKNLITFSCIVLILFQFSCKKQPSSQVSESKSETSSTPKPPDLSNCNRIEIEFRPTTKIYIFRRHNNLFDTKETEYVESIDKLVLTKPETIKALAEDISSSIYKEKVPGTPGIANIMRFTCFDKDGSTINFFAIALYIGYSEFQTEENYVFKNDNIRLNLIEPTLYKFVLRSFCASNFTNIIKSFRTYKNEENSYPPSDQWCDAIIKYYDYRGYTGNVTLFKHALICPGAGDGECHYAMNPNCKPDSPGDMVLLFETKGGWNQHGGPELFTFDNHDPKGGCVLLNDGTVKFIRTEGELNNLKWK